MKDIEEITRLSDAELEAIAKDESIETPSDLHAKAQEAILAAALSPQKRTPKAVTSILAAAALVAAALILLIGRPQKQPQDSFTNPLQAYACVESVFTKINSNAQRCATATLRAEERVSASLDEAQSILSETENKLLQ